VRKDISDRLEASPFSENAIAGFRSFKVVSECNSGIPLFQSYVFATWMDGYGWIATSIFSLKTIATSVALTEV